jgi:hypothetical protein
MKDPHLRQHIQAFRDKLLTLRRLTEERFELGMTAAAGSDIDQQYDVLFSESLDLVDVVEGHLREFIAGEVKAHRIIEGTLAFITLFLFILAGIFFHRHELHQSECEAHCYQIDGFLGEVDLKTEGNVKKYQN